MSRQCYLVSLSSVVLVAVLFSGAWAAVPAPDGVLYASYYVPDAIDYAGSAFLYLRNPTPDPLTVSEITLNGRSIGKIWPTDESFLGPEVRDQYVEIENDQLAWYRVFPNPIPPGGLGEVILRLVPEASDEPESTIGVTLQGYDPLETAIAMQEPAFSLEYVGIEGGLDVLHLYTRALPGADVKISRVEIDGRTVDAEVHNVFSGYTYAHFELPEAWEYGSCHLVAIGTAEDLRAVLIRALPDPAPLAIMGNTHAGELEQYANHLFEINIAFGSGPPITTFERLAEYGLGGAYPYAHALKPGEKKREPVYYSYEELERLELVKEHEALWGYFLEDEPDGRYHRTALPRGSISRDVERANQFCRIFDPTRPTYLQMDHGGYPRNMYIYSQIPDYVCTHAYALGAQTVVTGTQDHVTHTRNASRPRPFYYLNCGYCKRGESREFEPEEMHLEVYTALAEGVKSLQWYPAHGATGLLKHPRMWNAVGRVNGILHQVLPLLSIGVPVEEPRVEGGNFLSRSILCGDKAMAVVLVNLDFTADREAGFELNPATASVRVRLPRFFRAAGVVEPRFPEQAVQVPAELSTSLVEFSTQVQAGKILVIYSDDSLLQQMRSTHARCLEQFVPSPEAE